MNDDIIYRFEALAQDADGTVTPFVLRWPDLGSIGRAAISGSIARTFVASTKRTPARWRSTLSGNFWTAPVSTSLTAKIGRFRCPA